MLQQAFLDAELKKFINSHFTKAKWDKFLDKVTPYFYDSYAVEEDREDKNIIRLFYTLKFNPQEDEQKNILIISLITDEKTKYVEIAHTYAEEFLQQTTVIGEVLMAFWDDCDPDRKYATQIVDEYKFSITYKV